MPSGEQIPLDLGHDAASSREDLIISDPLTAAVSIIDRWPEWSSPVVILCGPKGAGKSHLASIWKEKTGAVQPIGIDAAAALIGSERLGHLLLEDVDRSPFDDEAFFHLFNAVRQQSITMLLTSRLWPAAWPVSLPDLKSRLKAATVVEIGEPDDDLLAQVIVKLFADRQISIDMRIVTYLVARMERSFQAAQDLVAEIDRLALARRTRITTTIAAEALKRHER